MMTSNATKPTEATAKAKYSCEFCNREFSRESTVLKHICTYKHRWIERDMRGNRLGFQSFLEFYEKNTFNKKKKTYEDFIRSPYYNAFVKFGNYCVEINALNVTRFIDHLVKNQIKIDNWTSDQVYTRYLIEYMRTEDPYDAIHRSVENTIGLCEQENIQTKDCLRYCNKNKLCHMITTGKISPWMLFQSKSGVEFLDKLDETQVKMVFEYIDPEKWALKFKREPENVVAIKELLALAGY